MFIPFSKKSVFKIALLSSLLISSSAQSFSFNMGDDDWNWGSSYRSDPGAYGPWGAPGYGAPPRRLSDYQRFQLRQRRQNQMTGHEDSMELLSEMLFGNKGFQREKAIELARQIQAASGPALTNNFHPGSVVTFGSRAAPSIWQNYDAFKANAAELQKAAGDLALELEKKPSAEQGAVYLKSGSIYQNPKERKVVPVSPTVWEKFNHLSATCYTCHNQYRTRSAWD